MRRLTEHERTALTEVDFNDGRSVPDYVFTELARLGYGFWAPTEHEPDEPPCAWFVTTAGREALRLDTIARSAA